MGHLVHFTNNIDGSLSRMTKTSQTVSHKLYNLNVDEDCVMYSTSELIMCFIDGFTSGMNSQSIASLQIESAHIYMRFVVKRPSRIQGQFFFRSWVGSDIPKVRGWGGGV